MAGEDRKGKICKKSVFPSGEPEEKAALCASESHIVAEDLGFSRVIYQDDRLYRFTSDAVLLSRFARAKAGDTVADFCAGSGIVAFHFYLLNGGAEETQGVFRESKKSVSFVLFEMQERLLSLARRTAKENGFEKFSFVEGRLQDLPKEYHGKFSLVLCNPPYETGGFDGDVYEKAVCRKEITITFEEIAAAAKKALKFGGRFAFVQRADRSAEAIGVLAKHGFAVKRVQFVSSKTGKKPYLVLAEAVYGGKEGVDVLPVLTNDEKSGGKTGNADFCGEQST